MSGDPLCQIHLAMQWRVGAVSHAACVSRNVARAREIPFVPAAGIKPAFELPEQAVPARQRKLSEDCFSQRPLVSSNPNSRLAGGFWAGFADEFFDHPGDVAFA